MKLEDQVVSLDLAKKLKELGVKQESEFYWAIIATMGGKEPRIFFGYPPEEMPNEDGVSCEATAFTVAELGEMLPISYQTCKTATKKWLAFQSVDFKGACENKDFMETLSATEADARAKMLIHLIEQKLVTP